MSNKIEIFKYNNPNARFGFTPNSILNLKEMGDNKQNSIDWLISILNKPGFTPVLTEEEIQQAKAMHKEEMIDFGNDLLAQNDTTYIAMPDKAEYYYNITFGGNNE